MLVIWGWQIFTASCSCSFPVDSIGMGEILHVSLSCRNSFLVLHFSQVGTDVATGVGNHDSDSRNTRVAINANPPSIRSSINDAG